MKKFFLLLAVLLIACVGLASCSNEASPNEASPTVHTFHFTRYVVNSDEMGVGSGLYGLIPDLSSAMFAAKVVELTKDQYDKLRKGPVAMDILDDINATEDQFNSAFLPGAPDEYKEKLEVALKELVTKAVAAGKHCNAVIYGERSGMQTAYIVIFKEN